jgi:molecular chaperone GrpE
VFAEHDSTRVPDPAEQAQPTPQGEAGPAPAAASQPEPAKDSATEPASTQHDRDAESARESGDEREAAGAQVEHDLDELLAKARERDEYLALAQRVQADFDNFRKRASRDVAAAELRGLGKLAKELLPAIDNLDRALASVSEKAGGEGGPAEGLVEGVKLVRSEMQAALERVGIQSYEPLGERFDPNIHEAMAQVPAAEGVESGQIVEVFQAGYRVDSTVLRPARVVVAQ